MPTLTISYSTEAERQAYERAIAFVVEMHSLGLDALDGYVLDACEAPTLSKGRGLLRQTLAAAAQARIDHVEKSEARVPPRPSDSDQGATAGPSTRTCPISTLRGWTSPTHTRRWAHTASANSESPAPAPLSLTQSSTPPASASAICRSPWTN